MVMGFCDFKFLDAFGDDDESGFFDCWNKREAGKGEVVFKTVRMTLANDVKQKGSVSNLPSFSYILKCCANIDKKISPNNFKYLIFFVF